MRLFFCQVPIRFLKNSGVIYFFEWPLIWDDETAVVTEILIGFFEEFRCHLLFFKIALYGRKYVMKKELTTPQALQLYFFLIMEKGCAHSMHLWMASNLRMWGCFLPISESQGRRISRPIFSEDLRWYNSFMASKRAANHSSFSLLVLKKIKKKIL